MNLCGYNSDKGQEPDNNGLALCLFYTEGLSPESFAKESNHLLLFC